MAARSPAQINDLFIEYMRRGDLDALVTLYDPEAMFRAADGQVHSGTDAIREQLAHFAETRAAFTFDLKAVIQSGDIALTHNAWKVAGPEAKSGYSLEVCRRQPDGTWRWLIGDPFTVGRAFAEREARSVRSA